MKAFNWIQQHKYPLVVIGFFLVTALCLYFFIDGIRKDHSMELTKQKIELKEEARQQVIQERNVWQVEIEKKDEQIKSVMQKDSALQQSILIINNQIDKLTNKTYVQSKTKVFDSYGSAELQQYYNNLPDEPTNDY